MTRTGNISLNASCLSKTTRTGPFKATQIWNEIIDHLKARVELKRRRLKMKSYENCFTGQDAVDVVLTYLLSDKNTFSSDLSRDKAIKLCQSLMNRNVFSPVSSREIKKFEDSHSKFYRFDVSDSDSESSSTATESSDDEYSVMDSNRRLSLRLNVDIYYPDIATKPDQIRDIINNQLSLKHNNPNISPEAIEDIWKEVALCQLLSIVDLSFVDGLLYDDKVTKKQVHQNLIISNMVSKHWNIPLSSLQDPFMQTAINCIECLPNGIVVLEKDFVRDSTPASKIQSFHSLSEHYTTIAEPLLPESFIDLHLAVLNLVLQEKDAVAIEALRLDMILLPWYVREELHRLLKFMSVASEESMQIDAKENNENLMLITFTDAILKHKIIANKLARILITFMVQNVKDIFTIPDQICQRVNSKIQDLKTGEVQPVRENVYCCQVSLDEYQKQTKVNTDNALIEMMKNIVSDTTMQHKDKKHYLRQFQKHHTELYDRHFSRL